MENREGVNKDGYKGPNRDTLRSLTTNYAHELQVVNEALRALETKDLHELNMQHKLLLLSHLCRACYDSNHVRHLLMRNQEERQNQHTLMWKHHRDESKKLKTVEPELREQAIEECRAANEAASILKQQKEQQKDSTSSSSSTAKGGKSKAKPKAATDENSGENAKNPFDPTGPQLAAAIEDIRLRNTIGIDVIVDDEMGDVSGDTSEKDDVATSTVNLTARGSLAELERRRKEREKSRLMKEDAIAWLQQALETERERDVKDALKYARQAELEGELEDGRSFCTPLMFKVYRKRAQLEVATKEARVASEHEKALTQYFIRTEPLGYDRHHRAYWCFDGDTRVFVQTTIGPDQLPLQPVNLAHTTSAKSEVVDCTNSDDDEDEDGADRLVSKDAATPLRPTQPPRTGTATPCTPATTSGGVLLLNGKMTAPANLMSPPGTATRINSQLYATKPSNVQHTWRIYGSMLEIWMLVEALDERGVREKDLKSKLRAKFGMNKGGASETYQSSGSEYIGRKIRRTFGRKVAYGTIVGWLPPEGDDEALWHVVHDDGDEEDLDLKDIQLSFKKEAEVLSEQGKAPQDAGATRKSARMMNIDNCDSDMDEVPEVVTEYINTMSGGLGVNAKQIGLSGLRGEMLRYESMLLEGLKSKGSGFHREGKRQWEYAVKTADTLAELRACVVSLEEVIHDTQEEEDEIDSKDTKNKQVVMLSDGWIFDPLDAVMCKDIAGEKEQEQAMSKEAKKVLEETKLQYKELEGLAEAAENERVVFEAGLESRGPVSKTKQNALSKKVAKAEEAKLEFEEFKEGLRHLQKRTRRFFDGHGASDGVVVAYLPGHLNEGVRLWHLEHDDGDTEDLDLQQVIRGQQYHANNAQEPDEDDPDAQGEDVVDDDEESQVGDSDPSDSESDEEEEEEDVEDGEQAKLWPSLNVRTRWIQATNEAVTVAEVSLAMYNLINCARSYGVVGEDPLAGAQGSRSSKKKATVSVTQPKASAGKRKRDNHSGGNSSQSSKKARGGGGTISKKSSSKKAAGGGRDYSGRGPRSLMDRAAKRCIMSYAED